MNKSQLVDHVAQETGLPKTKAQDAVEAIFDGIKSTLSGGGEVRLQAHGLQGRV